MCKVGSWGWIVDWCHASSLNTRLQRYVATNRNVKHCKFSPEERMRECVRLGSGAVD
jgi:hypothetical protein